MALNENAKKWVEALRSGKYQQGKKALVSRDGRYCCLGVACEVAIEGGVALTVTTSFDGNKVFHGCEAYLPPLVTHWLGLRDDCGRFSDARLSLAHLNDFMGKTLAEIADIIESEPKDLFTAPLAVTESQPAESHA